MRRARTETHVFERLYAIGKKLTSSLNMREVLRAILECAVEEAGGDLGWISLVEDGRFLSVVTAHGTDVAALPGRVAFGEGITGTVARTGKMYYAPDVTREENFIRVNDAVLSEVAVPLVVHGRLIGVFNIESFRRDAFSPAHIELISALAEQAAIAVHNAERYEKVDAALKRSLEKLRKKVKALKILSDVTSVISSSLQLDTVLSSIMDNVREVTDGAACQLILKDPETGKFIIHTPFSLPGGLKEGDEVDAARGITGWVIRHGKILNIPDVTRDDRYRCWIPDTRSEIAIPLQKEGELIGVLNVESPMPHAFDPDLVDMLNMLASHAAVAIRNAELFEKYRSTRDRLELSRSLAFIGEFAADIIHWFGNKAGLITACAESIAREAAGNPSVAEDVAVIKKHMAEVAEMKRRILGGGEGEGDRVVDVGKLVRDCAAAFGDAPVTVETAAETRARVKPRSLRKAFHAVLENAVQAVEGRDDGKVSVSVGRGEGGVFVRVKDNGPGFPREKLSLMFRPFFSAGKKGRGTGMGLWLCYRALKAMGAEIRVEGDTGKGLTFTLVLGGDDGER